MHQHIAEGGLAAARFPHQAEHLAFPDIQVDLADRHDPVLPLAEFFGKPPDLQEGGACFIGTHSPNSSFASTHRAMWPLCTTMGGVSFLQASRRL